MIAEMQLEIESIGPHLDQIARDWSAGVDHGMEWPAKIVAAKYHAVESAKRVVDMALSLETCRPLVYKIGWLKARGQDTTAEAAMAKLHVSECFVKNSLDALQLFGASGFASELGIERDLRDSLGSTIYSGTNDIQRNIIARHLIR